MSEAFDPYHRWLGIRDPQRPVNHYRLLGLDLYESDPEVIAFAADRQMSHVRTFSSGPHSELSQQLLNEIAAAKVCLLDPRRRAAYDQQLSQAQAPTPPSAWQAEPPPPMVSTHEVPAWQRPPAAQTLPQSHPSKSKYGHYLIAGWMGFLVIAVVGLALFQMDFTPEPPPRPKKIEENTPQVDQRGRLVVAASDEQMERRTTITGHKTSLSDFVLLPQTKQLLSVGLDRKVLVWSLPTLASANEVTTSNQMLRLLAASTERDTFAVCDYVGGGFVCSLNSPDQKLPLEGDTKTVRCLAMTPNGTQVIGGLENGSILVWEATTGQRMFEFSAHQGAVNQIVPLPEQEILSAGQDTKIYLSNLSTRRRTQTFLGHDHSVTALAVNPGQQWMVSGDASGTLIWWNYPGREVAKSFDAHDGEVTAVSITKDGLRAFSGGEDEQLHLWQLNTAEHLLTAPEVHVGRIGRIALSAREDLAFSADTSASIHVWKIADVETSTSLAPPVSP